MKENKMKTKRPRKLDGKCSDKPTFPRVLTTLQPPDQVKPLHGKLMYLDLPSNKLAETLERDIVNLGGTVEKFFSKEIKYLVTNKREARYVGGFRHDSPVPSPEPGSPGPNPTRCADGAKSQTHAGTSVASRGKSLVERVVKEKERLQMNKILSNALEWGVKILYIDDIIKYIDRKKKAVISQSTVASGRQSVKTGPAANPSVHKYRGGRINKPFVKVEDSSKHYRPIYLTLPKIPELNQNTVAPAAPFYLNEKESPGKRNRNNNASTSGGKTPARKKCKDRKRAGFCECCLTKYENLTAHLQCEQHKDFSRSTNYLVVDKLISAMHCCFLDLKSDVKRSKGSVLITSGLKQRSGFTIRKDWLADNRTQASVACSFGTKTDSQSGVSHREEDKRILTCSVLKRKCYERKRHQKSAPLCTQKSSEIACQKSEMAPPGGESLRCVPSVVAPVAASGQLSNPDISTSHLHDNTTGSDLAEAKQTRSSPVDPERRGNATPHKTTGSGHSEKGEDTCVPTGSPAPKLHRSSKPKRRKETLFVGHKRLRSSVNPIRRLWEVFQSSDDMDVEFKGFEDIKGGNTS